MSKKNHLKVVCSNPEFKKRNWLNESRDFEVGIPSFFESLFVPAKKKEACLVGILSAAFTDYDETTGIVDIPAPLRAKQAVANIKLEGSLNYYYKYRKEYLKQIV